MKIGFVGIGNMGGAILTGYADSEASNGQQLFAFDPNRESCRKMKSKVKELTLCKSVKDLCDNTDFLVIGVKPQIAGSVLEEVAESYRNEQVVISMVTGGVDIKTIEGILGADAKVIRIMPNTPAEVGEAMTAVCRNENVADDEFQSVNKILRAIGSVEEIDESLMGCAGGVSGSSPAYTYMYIEALMQAAMEYGMTEEKARIFAAQAVLGAAKIAVESGKSLKELKDDVCSPNGVTIEAVNTLEKNGFQENVKDGFRASMRRFAEIGVEK